MPCPALLCRTQLCPTLPYPTHQYTTQYYYTIILYCYIVQYVFLLACRSWLKVAPALYEGTALSPTPAYLEAWGAPAAAWSAALAGWQPRAAPASPP